MLGRIGNVPVDYTSIVGSTMHENRSRNEMDDMKKAIEYLYEFKEKLLKLHPLAIDAIETLLQRPRY